MKELHLDEQTKIYKKLLCLYYMNRLPIEIENKIWKLYYSHIYYVNVISLLV